MKKENLRDDFLSLGIESDKIISGMPAYEAVIDAVSMANRREEFFWQNLGRQSGEFCSSFEGEFLRSMFKSLDDEVKNNLEARGRDSEYGVVFSKLHGWLSKGFWESGYTCGSKLRLTIRELGGVVPELKDINDLPRSRRVNDFDRERV
jgi:hypothetical protein